MSKSPRVIVVPPDGTMERHALDLLLSHYPGFDLLSIDWGGGRQPDDLGPSVWVLVELGQRSADDSAAWARHRFAIFRATGAVHGMQADGSVTDDPLYVPDSQREPER